MLADDFVTVAVEVPIWLTAHRHRCAGAPSRHPASARGCAGRPDHHRPVPTFCRSGRAVHILDDKPERPHQPAVRFAQFTNSMPSPSAEPKPVRPAVQKLLPEEIGGVRGPEPTRYGDWDRRPMCRFLRPVSACAHKGEATRGGAAQESIAINPSPPIIEIHGAVTSRARQAISPRGSACRWTGSGQRWAAGHPQRGRARSGRGRGEVTTDFSVTVRLTWTWWSSATGH